ncbi:unnamed protein product [Urochloa humidicola]
MDEAIPLAVSKIETCLANEACKSAISKLSNRVTNLVEFLMKVDYIKKQLNMANAVIQDRSIAEMKDPLNGAVDWIARVKGLASRVESVVDKFLCCSLQLHGEGSRAKLTIRGIEDYARNFYAFTVELARIENEMTQIIEMRKGILQPFVTDELARIENEMTQFPQLSSPELIGADGPTDCLLKFLTDEGEGQPVRELKVLSIVGFGGIGKTALALQVYQKLQGKFQHFAFVTVSKMPDIKRVLQAIFNQICQLQSASTEDNDIFQLVHEIRCSLDGKRYIVVIDDLWDTEAWKTVNSALPDNGCGSRVIVTTRLNAIANSCYSGHKDMIYEVKPLTYENSKTLLLKGMPKVGCVYTAEATNNILKMCGGIPLAIVSFSMYGRTISVDLIPKKEKTIPVDPRAMEMIFAEDFGQTIQTLFRSCSAPPYTLEVCCLYLSIFPEKHKIERDSLVRKWIAEGFISEEGGLSLEEVANKYYDELINRNVIYPVECGNFHGEESYEVHPLMLYTLKQISKQRNYVTFLSDSESDHTDIYRLAVHYSGSGRSIDTKTKNLSCACTITVLCHLNPVSFKDTVCVRVLDLEGCHNLEDTDMHDICQMLLLQYLSLNKTRVTKLPPEIGSLQYLETLAVRNTPITNLPQQIEELQKLKTLDVRQTQITVLPPQIGKLQSLETLDVRHTPLKELPKELVLLPKLACLLFGQSSFLGGVKLPLGHNHLKSVKVLGAVDSRLCSESVIEELDELIELRELAVVLYDGPADKVQNDKLLSSIRKCRNLQSLVIYGDSDPRDELSAYLNLPPLQKVKVAGRFVKVPGWMAQLSTLTHLDIRVCKLEISSIGLLGDLPCLISLVLALVSLPKCQVVITNAGFRSLEIFTFDCRMPWIKFEPGAMPRVKHLELKLYAGPVGKIPSDIVRLQNLKKVVLRCSSQYAASQCVIGTIAALREEAANHANVIFLSINGEEEIFPRNAGSERSISGTEIEE